MTVQTRFQSWQTSPMQPSPGRCAPIGRSWWTYLRTHWGGQHLGCYMSRPVVGGRSPSSHASGAAIDWRYENPGPGRTVMLNETMPWLLNNSLELGVQALHDYAGRRIWRPPNCSERPASPSPECGWRASSGPQMNPANLWLHIEVHPSRWSDTRTVAEMLDTDAPPTPTPQPPQEDDMALTFLARSASGGLALVSHDGAGVGFTWIATADDAAAIRSLGVGQVDLSAQTFDLFASGSTKTVDIIEEGR